MNFRVKFSERGGSFRVKFGAVQSVSDGGYERGYVEGYDKGEEEGHKAGYESGYQQGNEAGQKAGYTDGHAVGYAEGLAARKYETWTITLVDGTVIEKEVALL